MLAHMTGQANDLQLEAKTDSDRIKGLCWIGRDSIVSDNFDDAINLSANWLSLTAFGWMEAHDQPTVSKDNKRYWWGEKDQGLKHTARLAKKRGLRTMLKPHIWLSRSNGKWREDISMDSAEEWNQWFESYEDWIMHYAQLASEAQIDALCIGTELYHASSRHSDKWVEIIRKIRSIYNGDLMYAANWYREYEHITFWNELDYIGIQGYFPIGKFKKSNKKSFNKSWRRYKKSIHRISKKYDKKVIFTEIGYANHKNSASKPWEWPQDVSANETVSNDIQKQCYESFFESLWNESWFHGVFIWEWHHPTYKERTISEYFAKRLQRLALWQKQTQSNVNPQFTFSPQEGSALNVLKNWYQHN